MKTTTKPKKIIHTITRLIEAIENFPINFRLWIISLFGIIALRIIIENWLGAFPTKGPNYFFYHVSYNFLFFSFTYLIFTLITSKLLKINIRKVSNFILLGYLIILFPPLIDYIISGGKGFISFYGIHDLKELFERFFTFFGDNPKVGVTYGVRTEIAFTIISLLVYGYIKSKSILKALSLSLIAYTILFILGTFPSWITILIKGFPLSFSLVTETDVVQMFLSPATIFSQNIGTFINALSIKMSFIYSILIFIFTLTALFLNQKNNFIEFIKNIRPLQVIYHIALLFIGVGLGFIFTNPIWEFNFFNLLALIVIMQSVITAWASSVVVNDLFDQEIDKISNRNRPLIRKVFSVDEYKTIGIILFFASIFFAAIVSFKIAFLIFGYHALAWIYSAWPLRLKKYAYLGTLISAVASLLILFSGFILTSPDQNISNLPSSISALIIISFTISLPIKDLKDVLGDKKDKVYTVPVIFGEEWGKILIGSGIFISYLISVVALNSFSMFWISFLFGGFSFWLVLHSGENNGLNYRKLLWAIFGLTFIYGTLLIRLFI